ncbi:hypothetical protein [Pseudomonas asplenii]|uniref:hypothetical protein n=1 Tax=Pseudomonas asplenii TaxID=53407 RepID=UPI0012FBD3FC|nr:hypothetical protein [Pseudomonas fuscovaginae]
MDFTTIISQVWGIPSWIIPAMLLALLKSSWTKGDIGELLMRFRSCWQLNIQTHHPPAGWQYLKCGNPLLVRDVKSGVKAGPLHCPPKTFLSTPPYISLDLQDSTSNYELPATIFLMKTKSALVHFDTEKTNVSEKHELYELGALALTLSLTSSILP